MHIDAPGAHPDASPDSAARSTGRPGDDELRILADAVMSLSDDMHEALLPVWEPLTGLQVLFLRIIARYDRVTRQDLMSRCRTSRAAVTPGLASMVHRGYVVETPDGAETVLTLGPEGSAMLMRMERARVAFVRRALEAHDGRLDGDVDRTATVIRSLRDATATA
ncbi:MarR family transcriptional regulator [Clavibacter michiganensis subsp. phaseoli]|uniref:MarR family transcriptional regulator n=1 Tax=Clavibacter phaseoli TaxID=1734031 RepID=UPI000E66CBC4|nr:MarR family transcriptional regulator [Clavibacter phaseoli]MCJ1710915.1 MarR family transcriptional regulator [Clavibacter phaseoli]RII89414.1 MarR family transcriptional regulator [Clavibacter michiganensis]